MKNKSELKYYTYELDMIFLNILSLVIFGVVWGLVILISKGNFISVRGNTGILIMTG